MEYQLTDTGFTLIQDHVEIEDSAEALSDYSVFYAGVNRLMLMVSNYDGAWHQQALIRRKNTGDTLDNIVSDLLIRAGYEVSDFDVTGLAAIEVDGYVINRQMSVASSLTVLQYFMPFDLVEENGQLKAIPRGQTVAVKIALDDLGADVPNAKRDKIFPSLTVKRLHELDLPVELTIDVLDESRDYEVSSQRARRLMAQGGPRATKLILPLVCSASKAKQIAEKTLYDFWLQRDSYYFSLSNKWAGLSPADIVEIDDKKIRITEITAQKGVLLVDGVSADGDALFSVHEADNGDYRYSSLLSYIPSVLFLMDVPLLRNEDNQAGLYIAATGNAGWSGASVWRSSDGVSFVEKAQIMHSAIAGAATTQLGPANTHYVDRINSVRIQTYQGNLASCTEAELLNGTNVALLGAEIIQFQQATLVGPGLYELSVLLRGRLGTESEVDTHALTESFVLLNENTVQFLPALLTERNLTYSFRAVTYGSSLGTAANLRLSYDMKTLCPLAPVHVRASRIAGVGSDCTFSWIRRARMNAAWVDYIDVPLDEASERYDLEILDSESVVRVFENITETSQFYSAADQAADWPKGVPASFTIKVYQRSDCYGRGRAAVALV